MQQSFQQAVRAHLLKTLPLLPAPYSKETEPSGDRCDDDISDAVAVQSSKVPPPICNHSPPFVSQTHARTCPISFARRRSSSVMSNDHVLPRSTANNPRISAKSASAAATRTLALQPPPCQATGHRPSYCFLHISTQLCSTSPTVCTRPSLLSNVIIHVLAGKQFFQDGILAVQPNDACLPSTTDIIVTCAPTPRPYTPTPRPYHYTPPIYTYTYTPPIYTPPISYSEY